MLIDLVQHHAPSGTAENLGTFTSQHDVDEARVTWAELLTEDHGRIVRTWPGIGAGVTNVSYEDGHSIYFRQTPAPAAALTHWAELVTASEQVSAPQSLDQILAVRPRPDWSDECFDQMGSAASGGTFNSTPAQIPLSRHRSQVLASGRMVRAHAEVWVRQTLDNVAPTIGLNRWALVDGKPDVATGSPYILSLEEATALAQTLLAAVAVASAPEPGTDQAVA